MKKKYIQPQVVAYAVNHTDILAGTIVQKGTGTQPLQADSKEYYMIGFDVYEE